MTKDGQAIIKTSTLYLGRALYVLTELKGDDFQEMLEAMSENNLPIPRGLESLSKALEKLTKQNPTTKGGETQPCTPTR